LQLLKTSRKFKHWLGNVAFDVELVAAYEEEIRKESKLEKKSSKLLRWAIIYGLGKIVEHYVTGGNYIADGINALDKIFIDSLIKGWKPNQFVDQYKSMVPRR
jgi:hypothetical protein